jgi:hypothetical protein
MQASMMVDFSPKDSTSISLQKNPFYLDKKQEYESIVSTIKSARRLGDVGSELDQILRVAEWRLMELDKAQPQAASPKAIDQADTEDALKKIIAESSGEARALAKEKLESLIIDRLKKTPSRSVFAIPSIQPSVKSYKARISVVAVAAGGEFAMFSTERYPHDGPLRLGGSMMGELPMGDESVHRYEVEFSPPAFGKYKFIGNKEDPLTFILLKGVGYAYLHGKGRVVTPDGKEVILPPNQ